jgi:signal peptidase I
MSVHHRANAHVTAAGTAALPRGRRWLAAIGRQRLLLDVLLGASFMIVVHLFVVQISIVKGHSMEPSLQDGDRLVVDRVSCSLGEMHRGDVVVLRYPRNPEVDFVKRIVGLPGDRVALRNGQLWVNGAMAPDDWTCIADRETTRDVQVPSGCYFVLGDNRPISCDSREFGLVPGELLKGRVRARFWPLDRVAVF